MKGLFKLILLSVLASVSVVSTSGFAVDKQEVMQEVSDAAIVTKINAYYLADESLNPLKIQVSSQNGIVALEGTVKTDKQFYDAVAIAQSVKGVKNVMAGKLKVQNSDSAVSDLLIEARVEANLIKNKFLDPESIKYWPITVLVKDGNVTLEGEVDNPEQRQNIIYIVTNTSGVKSVNSDKLTFRKPKI